MLEEKLNISVAKNWNLISMPLVRTKFNKTRVCSKICDSEFAEKLNEL